MMIKEQSDDSGTSSPALHKTQCYTNPGVNLFNEDCIETMQRIETGSVDLILTDPPYGITSCDWDIAPNMAILWQHWERILADNGVVVVTSSQPFTSEVVMSRRGFFRYELIWEKAQATGFLDANKKPMKKHESILVFSKKGHPKYNVQKIPSSRIKTKGQVKTSNVGSDVYRELDKRIPWIDDGERYAHSILFFQNDDDRYNSSKSNKKNHPTQKPFDLFRWLIRAYSNENETVFDGYSGSGTTAAACIKEKRKFIGSEMNKDYFDMSVNRLSEMIKKPELF